MAGLIVSDPYGWINAEGKTTIVVAFFLPFLTVSVVLLHPFIVVPFVKFLHPKMTFCYFLLAHDDGKWMKTCGRVLQLFLKRLETISIVAEASKWTT